jgi:hypothetical protein
METTVATLLLVASAVILACVVVNYAVGITEQTMKNPNIPELGRLKDFQNSLLNQTDTLFNSTVPQSPNQSAP